MMPFDYRPLLRIMENAMLKKAAAKSCNEAAKLRKTFKAGLRPPPIPDGIVDFLQQNSPSAKVNITTKYTGYFNIKQVEKSIKGAKITGYRSQHAAPASSPSAHANATEFASAAVPSPASAAESTSAGALAPASSPAHAAPASAVESASADSLGSASYPGPAALASAATPASAALPASAPSPCHHLCCAEKVTTNVDSSDSMFWPDIVTKTFIDIMVDEVTKGNMSNGVFHTRTWTSMTNRLNSITNCSYEEEQLKAKMHCLRAMFHEFYSLLQNVGFVWNSETNTVTASEEVWKNYLKTHDKASQFQNKGCDHYRLLEIIFNKYNETEVLHHSIAQDQPNTNKENEHDNQYFNTRSANCVCVDNDSSDNGIQEVECITCRGKQKIQLKDRTSEKVSTSRQMGDAIAAWAQAWGKIVEASSSHVTTNCSLTKCVVALEEIGDISDDIYGKALEKFKDPDWREMFVAMSTDKRRGWLFRL
ncbi:L10-interacting MYB domain-containing protein [Medicago truncatula]|nr:L10-interacting MYB domain-containing protein [Medicago truncatula]